MVGDVGSDVIKNGIFNLKKNNNKNIDYEWIIYIIKFVYDFVVIMFMVYIISIIDVVVVFDIFDLVLERLGWFFFCCYIDK